MTKIKELVGKNIRAFRQQQGLSQEKLAELVNTAPHYILMIENARSWPSAKMVERIAAALGKDSVELFSLGAVQWDWKQVFLEKITDFVKNVCNDSNMPPSLPDQAE
jgi:transcriptional regulator with XRE-family HTH domain